MVSCNFYRGKRLRTEIGITILLIGLMVGNADAAVLEVNSNNGIGIKSIVYPSIQGAIDGASDGDLIIVTPGTYYENLTISNKNNLTITGAGIGSVIIQPNVLKTTGVAHKYDPDMHVAIFVNRSTNLTIQGVTISGGGLSPNAVVFWNAASGEIKDARITDTTPISGIQTGQGVAVDASSGMTSSLTITNVQIDGFNKNGIDAVDGNGGTSPGTITVNVNGGSITGFGPTDMIAQNGILFWNKGTGNVGGSINGASISNLNYIPTTNEATGILGYSGGPDSISNSVFSNVESYIYASSNIDANAGNTFDGVVASSATDAQLFVIEDMIYHKLDDATLGLVTIKPNNVYVTPASGSIQRGIDAISANGIVNVATGTYGEPLNISSKTGLTIRGIKKTSVILTPSSVLNWGACGYAATRKAAVRIVNSSDVVLQNMTMNYDLVKANSVFGVFGCDSTVTLNNNIFQNMSVSDVSGGYGDLGTYFRAPGFTEISRADITISDNTFIDMGRVGVVTHDYINATIKGNIFYKTTDDFGYAMEIGSQSTGVVRNNLIYGYDTPAASDGSESAGIYIESAFTGWNFVNPPHPHMDKNIIVENNEVNDSQMGMWIGNGYDGYSGDIDIKVLLNNNNFHDNWQAGVMIQDEDKSDGSSVTVNGSGNILKNNGNIGYWIFTQGDGNITVGLAGENITGQHDGVYLEDTGGLTSTSSYDVSIHWSNISGNMNYGINNTISSMVVNATLNWWGDDSGPGPVGPGSGDNVSTNVLYDPWLPIDLIPPASVTDLVNVSYADNYINWTWTDPADLDFKKVLIFLDGIPKGEVLKGVQYYNTTVSPGTYTIGTQTVDERGNVNATIKTHTATTVLPLVRFINGTVFESPDHLAGIPDATVTIGSQTTTTNATGFYSFAVPDGSYSLTATLDPTYYANSSIPVSTTGEAVVVQDIELELKPTGTISGSVKIG